MGRNQRYDPFSWAPKKFQHCKPGPLPVKPHLGGREWWGVVAYKQQTRRPGSGVSGYWMGVPRHANPSNPRGQALSLNDGWVPGTTTKEHKEQFTMLRSSSDTASHARAKRPAFGASGEHNEPANLRIGGTGTDARARTHTHTVVTLQTVFQKGWSLTVSHSRCPVPCLLHDLCVPRKEGGWGLETVFRATAPP